MRTFNEPKVYLINRPRLDWEGITDFLSDEDLTWRRDFDSMDGDMLPEFAGRICYVSFGDRQGRTNNDDYIQNILRMGHGSVLEHANYTFLITNASRGFTHEMVRHRAGFAYSQESTHYIDYSKENAKVLMPDDEGPDGCYYDIYREGYESSLKAYNAVLNALIDAGIPKKQACSTARSLLPIGIESRLVFTGNIRSLRHFIQTRGNAHNVDEIRKIAVKVLNIMKAEAPNCFKDMHVYTEDDKSAVKSEYVKV